MNNRKVSKIIFWEFECAGLPDLCGAYTLSLLSGDACVSESQQNCRYDSVDAEFWILEH